MKELKQINIEDAVGKKIVKVTSDIEYVGIKYDDDSFSFFKVYEDWGYNKHIKNTEINLEKLIREVISYGTISDYFKVLYDLELVTEEEVLSIPQVLEAKSKKAEEIKNKELAELKRLREKYKNE